VVDVEGEHRLEAERDLRAEGGAGVGRRGNEAAASAGRVKSTNPALSHAIRG
jgi:hypothetical protein